MKTGHNIKPKTVTIIKGDRGSTFKLNRGSLSFTVERDMMPDSIMPDYSFEFMLDRPRERIVLYKYEVEELLKFIEVEVELCHEAGFKEDKC